MNTFLLRFTSCAMVAIFLNCSGNKQQETEQKTDTLQVAEPENSSLPAEENTSGFSKTYLGDIGSKYPIRMQLTRSDNELKGSYAYIKVGKEIPLAGSVDSEGNFSIQETNEQGKITGIFEGKFIAASQLSGNWRNPATGKALPFTLQESAGTVTAKNAGIVIGPGIELLENTFTLEGKNGIDGEYTFPYMKGEGMAAIKINEALTPKNLIDETIEEMQATFKDCSCGTVGVSYTVNYNANNILDMTVFIETLGAYSSGYVKRYTFNTATGEKLSIGQLLKPASLPPLASECDALLQERIKKSLGNAEDSEGAEWLKELTAGKTFDVEHLENFSISAEGITFYYPFGFPHAAAALEPDDAFLFSFAQLKDDIEPAGVLGSLVQAK